MLVNILNKIYFSFKTLGEQQAVKVHGVLGIVSSVIMLVNLTTPKSVAL